MSTFIDMLTSRSTMRVDSAPVSSAKSVLGSVANRRQGWTVMASTGDGHLFQTGCPGRLLHPGILPASNVDLTTAPFRASPDSTVRRWKPSLQRTPLRRRPGRAECHSRRPGLLPGRGYRSPMLADSRIGRFRVTGNDQLPSPPPPPKTSEPKSRYKNTGQRFGKFPCVFTRA